MNKEKVIKLVTGLVENTEDYLMMGDQSLMQNCKNREKEAIAELNSKPVMPKVFDEWYKTVIVIEESREYELVGALLNVGANEDDDIDMALYYWIMKDMGTRFHMCAEAIIHDYEVEKGIN